MTDTLPNFWITGLAKGLTGEQPCLLEPWLKGRKLIDKARQNPSMARWKADHTKLLHEERADLEAAGWRVQVERYFRVQGATAIIAAKPDLVAQQRDRRPKVVDVKGGEPKDYYVAQVAAYCVLLPLAWGSPGMVFDGEVVYGDGERVPVTPEQAAALRPRLFELVRRLAGETRPPASPSEHACRWCEAGPTTCPDRFAGTAPVVQTAEF